MQNDPETTIVNTEVLRKLIEISHAVLQGDYSKRIVTNFNDELITKLVNNLNRIADDLLLNPPETKGRERIDIGDFIDTISSFANHDFQSKLPISENGTILDAIAIGINLLGDELEQSTASKHELEEERNRLNEAQAIAKIGSWDFNLKTKIFTGSREFFRIFDFDNSDSSHFYDFYRNKYHPDDLYKFDAVLQAIDQKEAHFQYEHRIASLDQTIKHLSCIGEIVQILDGHPFRIKGTVQDITEHKNAEIDLNNSFNTVSEQNKRLLNFSYIVSHNLRSHTGNIKSILKLVEESDSDKEKQELMSHMKTVSRLLNETMINLNEMVSIQNNINLIIGPLNLNDYVAKAIDILSLQIDLKNATIQNNVPKEITISYNPAYLESIVLNFLSNSIKYSYPGRRPVICIDCFKEEGKTVLQIADNGIGIDLHKYGDKLFGMYKTFNGNKDARGIGLFISKNQIDSLGGKVEVVSELNKGTTFKIFVK
jgi:signal transduction histidine kinase